MAASHTAPAPILGATDLARYEAIAAWDREQVIGAMAAALAPVINEFGGPASDTARALHAAFELAEWPPDPARRPAYLQELLGTAIESAAIEDVRAALRSLRLSDTAADVAASAAAGK